MENINPDPPTASDNEMADRPLHDLVGDDRFYESVNARLEDPNARDGSGYTLLHVAAWSREENSRILRLLLDRHADVNATARHDYTPLHVAVGFRNRKAVAALLEAGASVGCRDDLGRSVLHLAVGTNWPDPAPYPLCDMSIVDTLVNHPDADLEAVNSAGSTPLMWAVRAQNSNAVEALLKKGADPTTSNKRQQTPLHVALLSEDPSSSIVCALLSRGVGLYCEDRFGRTPADLFFQNLPPADDARRILRSIVLRYRVKASFVRQLERIPRLFQYYETCRAQVRRMKEEILYEGFTLHDFACDCFHLNVEDPVEDIFTPVVRMLLSGSYAEYEGCLLRRMPTRDLCVVLGKLSGILGIEQIFETSTHAAIFWGIRTFHSKDL